MELLTGRALSRDISYMSGGRDICICVASGHYVLLVDDKCYSNEPFVETLVSWGTNNTFVLFQDCRKVSESVRNHSSLVSRRRRAKNLKN